MRTLVLAAVATVTLTVGSGQAIAAERPTLVVDDDREQCAKADTTSINDAVEAADPGDVIRVCPGYYRESVTVDKPLTLKGDPDTVEADDCFSSTPPTTDATTQAIVAAPAAAPDSARPLLFDLQADSIDLGGFVLLGQPRSSSHPGSDAVKTASGHSGYRVHHNLIMANTVGAFFNSSGELPSSFDHNCLRENGWGVSNQFLPLVEARIHHNSSFGTRNYAYEQTAGTDRVIVDHNVSTADDSGFFFGSSTSTTASKNTVTSARVGMRSYGGNEDLHIIDNRLEVRLAGIVQPSTLPTPTGPVPLPPNIRALIQKNTITGTGTSAGIGMGTGALRDSLISDNVVTGLDGQGIALLAGSINNVVRGNTVTNNGANGILAGAAPTSTFEANEMNTFEANTMFGNGRITSTGGVDARDDHARVFNVWANVWRANLCLTDIPHGTICGVGLATGDG